MSEQRLMKVLLAPLMSEKTARLADRNRQFAFKVVTNATKPEVRQAVEMLFSVKVTGVQMANVRGKTKRLGSRSNWKKAFVTLAEGNDINFMGAE
ncbi:MAG: 50S ribosomal protein L23 [Gammaproteobacteria bacterium]|jgi:large subunit ribosomal protein L23|nr:50S ribosomal protein L23 [Gammaproteobacteria bacterium]